MAALQALNLARLSPALLDSALLPLLLPPAWRDADEVAWAPADAPTAPATAPAAAPGDGAPAAAAGALAASLPAAAALAGGGPSGPSSAWLRALWAWLVSSAQPDGRSAAGPSAAGGAPRDSGAGQGSGAGEGGGGVLALRSWPLLPIQGGRLGRLRARSLVSGGRGHTHAFRTPHTFHLA